MRAEREERRREEEAEAQRRAEEEQRQQEEERRRETAAEAERQRLAREAAAKRRGMAGFPNDYDIGLRAHMFSVYNYMAGGVALTGLVAWFTYQASVVTNASGSIVGLTPFGQPLFGSPLMWVPVIAPLLLVFFVSFLVGHMQASTAKLLFFVYAGLMGVSLATIFMVYTQTSITRALFISAAAFGALSLYGYTTQRSLDGRGSFLIMGLFGLIIASLVNIFLKSSGLDWVLSVIGVLIFAGLTARDTQKIKEFYDPQDDGTIAGRKAIMGALSLYLVMRRRRPGDLAR
jgi:uncharacterized protein